jgi:hypothetical protein
MTTSHCTKEIFWLKQLLTDVGHMQEGPIFIMCDNQGCIAIANNSIHHSRTKHIDVQHRFIREKLENQDICFKYCPMLNMIADVLTKPLAKDRHQTSTKAMSLKAFDNSQSEGLEGRTLDCL